MVKPSSPSSRAMNPRMTSQARTTHPERIEGGVRRSEDYRKGKYCTSEIVCGAGTVVDWEGLTAVEFIQTAIDASTVEHSK